MPNISELRESRFITKNDVTPPALFTVIGNDLMNVEMESAPKKIRRVLKFAETSKPFVLNSTNGQIIAQFMGSNEMNDWNGRKIVLYFEPSVPMRGEIVGGIRARAPKNQAGVSPAQRALPDPVRKVEPPDEDTPF